MRPVFDIEQARRVQHDRVGRAQAEIGLRHARERKRQRRSAEHERRGFGLPYGPRWYHCEFARCQMRGEVDAADPALLCIQ